MTASSTASFSIASFPGFMIQGGGFEPGMKQKKVKAPIKNEATNGLKNSRGTLAMARTNDINSATAQFFVNLVDNDFLDHAGPSNYGYAVFGKVTSGMDVIDKIAKVATTNRSGHQNVPAADVTITKASTQECEEEAGGGGWSDGLLIGLAAAFLVTALPVVAMRWMDPWYSAFMLDAALDASRAGKANYQTDYRWVDLEQISPHAAVAVIAAEDQFFPFHTGFDFKSIREAVRHNEAQAEQAQAARARRQHHHPAGGEEPVPLAGPQLRAQGSRGLLHAAHRAHLAEGTHHRGVSQRRAVRRWHLWRGGGRAAFLPHAGGAARPLRKRHARRRAAQSRSPSR